MTPKEKAIAQQKAHKFYEENKEDLKALEEAGEQAKKLRLLAEGKLD